MVEVLRVHAQRETLALDGLSDCEILSVLQQAVGGDIALQKLPAGRFMVVNEDAALKELPYNALASGIWGLESVGSPRRSLEAFGTGLCQSGGSEAHSDHKIHS